MQRCARSAWSSATTSPSGSPPIAGGAAATTVEAPTLDRDKILTLTGIAVLIAVALAFDVDVGFVALSIAAVLSLISPGVTKGAVNKVAWPMVLLICGIVMYVGLLESIGTIDWLGEQVATIGAVGLIIALSISSSVVDSSPFSTNGALTVANTPEEKREHVFKRLLQWGLSMAILAPPIAWLVFVVPGWL